MNKKRRPAWFPYPSEIKVKTKYITIEYKGGEFSGPIQDLSSILLYGSTCPLKQDFIDLCSRHKIPVCIHYRNRHQVTYIISQSISGKEDIITKQILFRENTHKRTYISRMILIAKFKSMSWLVPIPLAKLSKKIIDDMIQTEAQHARIYWDRYYSGLGYPEETRRGRNKISSALDAVSKFVSSIILRYVVFHNMSPYHAYIHKPTEYPSLLYDLMEPYRGVIEKSIFKKFKDLPEHTKDADYVGIAIATVEELLDTKFYTEPTRQIVTFQELLHGIVLALRSYLLGESHRFMIPLIAKPSGGRPKKTGYSLYGRKAGPYDFWKTAREISIEQENENIEVSLSNKSNEIQRSEIIVPKIYNQNNEEIPF